MDPMEASGPSGSHLNTARINSVVWKHATKQKQNKIFENANVQRRLCIMLMFVFPLMMAVITTFWLSGMVRHQTGARRGCTFPAQTSVSGIYGRFGQFGLEGTTCLGTFEVKDDNLRVTVVVPHPWEPVKHA